MLTNREADSIIIIIVIVITIIDIIMCNMRTVEDFIAIAGKTAKGGQERKIFANIYLQFY